MKVNNFAKFVAVSAVVFVIAGCITEPPYVSRPYAIDRGAPDFPDGPELTDGATVTVCYASNAATPDEVRRLAAEECRRFGLKSEYFEQTYENCPVRAPVAAVFTCVDSNLSVDGVGSRAAGTGTVSRPSTSAFDAPRGVLPPSFGLGAEDVSTTAKSEPFPTFLLNPPPTR